MPRHIVSQTGKKFNYDQTFPKYAKLIGEMSKEDNDEDIRLSFDSKTIETCIKFCKQYDIEPFVVPETKLKTRDEINQILPQWCITLLNIPTNELFDLMNMANFVDIDVLIDTTCMKIASLMKGNDCKQILNIKNEFENQDDIDRFIRADSWVVKKTSKATTPPVET